MKGLRVLFLVAVVVCSFASRANAQGSVTWASGYPQAGTQTGTIVGQGTATPDSGWMTGGATVVYWPQGSGLQQTATMTIDMNGNWSFTISGTPDTTYNVVVQVNFFNQQMMTMATVYSAPATATAAP
jgi:hypothetical protein